MYDIHKQAKALARRLDAPGRALLHRIAGRVQSGRKYRFRAYRERPPRTMKRLLEWNLVMADRCECACWNWQKERWANATVRYTATMTFLGTLTLEQIRKTACLPPAPPNTANGPCEKVLSMNTQTPARISN